MSDEPLLYVVAGEASGDTRGAELLAALTAEIPKLQICGAGGPKMRRFAASSFSEWTEEAVVGIWEVAKKWGYFKREMARMLGEIELLQPKMLLLIDYPGFNLRLAEAAKARCPQLKTVFYISPQVWAWKKGRLKVMARVLDLMVCIFPFEKALYEKSGLRTEFSGHPMVDRLQTLRRPWDREPGLVGWFPGSRVIEVKKLFPMMLKAAKLIKAKIPHARFAVSAANEHLASLMREMVEESDMPEARAWIETGTVYDLMQRAEVGVVASGTATLEAACFGLPYALVYKVAWPTYLAAKFVVRIKHIGIVNVLAGKEVVKELVQGLCSPDQVAATLVELLTDPPKREALQKELSAVVATLGEPGAYARAASYVLAVFEGK